jgi:ABC-2 type transport system ATP-binding protein
VEIDTGTGTRRFPEAVRADIPRLVRELVTAGEDVFEVRVVSSTLEEVYLEVVE